MLIDRLMYCIITRERVFFCCARTVDTSAKNCECVQIKTIL